MQTRNLQKIVDRIVLLGQKHQRLSFLIERGKIKSPTRIENLKNKHDQIIDEKVFLINRYYKITNQKLRIIRP
jgi:hypothetical protein